MKSGFHCVEQGEFLGLSLFFTGFVPGTNWVCPWDNSGEKLGPTGQKKLCLCAFFLRGCWARGMNSKIVQVGNGNCNHVVMHGMGVIPSMQELQTEKSRQD